MSSAYDIIQRVYIDRSKLSKLALVKFSVVKPYNPTLDPVKQSVGAVMTLDGEDWTVVDFAKFKKEWKLLK